MIQGWLRSDGRKGIRNVVAVAYLVECAHHVARRIVDKADDPDVQLIGFPGCYPNAYAAKVMEAIATHPNVGGLVIVSLGCESFNREKLRAVVEASGRPAELLEIQEKGGTAATIAAALISSAPMYSAAGLRFIGASSSRASSGARLRGAPQLAPQRAPPRNILLLDFLLFLLLLLYGVGMRSRIRRLRFS